MPKAGKELQAIQRQTAFRAKSSIQRRKCWWCNLSNFVLESSRQILNISAVSFRHWRILLVCFWEAEKNGDPSPTWKKIEKKTVLAFCRPRRRFGPNWKHDLARSCFILKKVFLGQEVHYYMVHIAYHELDLPFAIMRKSDANVKIANTRLTKTYAAIFALAERLPTSATLMKLMMMMMMINCEAAQKTMLRGHKTEAGQCWNAAW